MKKTRRERREEARKNKVEFVPQYNFGANDMQDNGKPLRVQVKSVLKAQLNADRRKNKKSKITN